MYLIVGGDSLIGSALSDYWLEKKTLFRASTRKKEKVADDRPFIDLKNIDTFQKLDCYKSAVICAAITGIAESEKNPDRVRKVNVTGIIELAKWFNKHGIHFVFLSTSLVFDGKCPNQKPNAPRNPFNEYGRQNAEVEIFVEKLPNACILRLTKVIHPGLELLKRWKNNLSNGHSIYAFGDMTLSPVNLDEVVQKIDRLIKDRTRGIYQLSGENDISYYDFALEFAKKNGYSPDLVKKDFWKRKLEFESPSHTSMVNV